MLSHFTKHPDTHMMNLLNIDSVNPFLLALQPVRKRGSLKLQSITHNDDYFAFKTPVMTTPFGITQFDEDSDLKLVLEFDDTDDDHRVFRQMLTEVHEQLAKSAPCEPIVKQHAVYGDRVEVKLDVKDITDFRPIRDLEGNRVYEIPRRARVRAVVHVDYLWLRPDKCGIKLKCKLLQLVSLQQTIREPSPEVGDPDEVFAPTAAPPTPASLPA